MTIKKESSGDEASLVATEEKEVSNDVFADFDFSTLEVSLPSLLKSGAHFGHQKSRRNPKMDQFIYTTRNRVSIIDLAQTADHLQKACAFLSSVKRSGKEILFVGTKRQAHDVIISAAKQCDMPYVVGRWLGGTFTNFSNIRKRARYLVKMQDALEKGDLKKYTKFEQMKKQEEIDKLERKMGGIKNMSDLPGAVFVMDLKEDHLAVKEAQAMRVPIVAIADTNTNPTDADYPIPANDDALSSLTLIMAHVCKAVGIEKK